MIASYKTGQLRISFLGHPEIANLMWLAGGGGGGGGGGGEAIESLLGGSILGVS